MAYSVSGSGGAGDISIIEHQVSSGTEGGTFTSGAWQTRPLNTEVVDTGSNTTLASNQITLQPGTYRCWLYASSYSPGSSQLRLQNITDTATLILGPNNRGASDSSGNGPLGSAFGRFTIASAKVLEVQHRCNVTQATYGFGLAASWGTEVYCQAVFFKE